MARQGLSKMKVEEIQRLLALGRRDREIARSLRCSRNTVKRIRQGRYGRERPLVVERPWVDQMAWSEVVGDFQGGHPLKFIWQERASQVTTYSNFWKAFYQKFPQFRVANVTPREFAPAERCEVDWAGGRIPWVEPKSGEVHEATVFVGILCFSQLIFASAKESMKGPHFLECHSEMLAAFGGVPHVIAPDCLKTGVSKIHLYDPDINPAYQHWASHYQVAIVPCRPSHPKDKALVEGAVRLVMRWLKWISRHQPFTSLQDIQRALKKVEERINQRPHSRFQISRQERFEKGEQAALKPLPQTAYEIVEWREAKLHPDSHIVINNAYYSAPHHLRGRTLKVKVSSHQIEIFYNSERVALHNRARRKDGIRVTHLDHLPENARAYREATPQNLLSQARFLSPDLYALIDHLFEADALGHLRRSQGFIREARKEIEALGHERARQNLAQAIELMKRFEKVRVPFLRELLNRFRLEQHPEADGGQEILRDPLNPLLRYPNKETIEDVLNAH